MNEKHILKSYIRDERNQPIGIVVAIGRNQVAMSMCATNKGDTFSKKIGYDIALGRAVTKKWDNSLIQDQLQELVELDHELFFMDPDHVSDKEWKKKVKRFEELVSEIRHFYNTAVNIPSTAITDMISMTMRAQRYFREQETN